MPRPVDSPKRWAPIAPVWFFVSVLFLAVLGIKPRPSLALSPVLSVNYITSPISPSLLLLCSGHGSWHCLEYLSACVHDLSLTQPHIDTFTRQQRFHFPTLHVSPQMVANVLLFIPSTFDFSYFIIMQNLKRSPPLLPQLRFHTVAVQKCQDSYSVAAFLKHSLSLGWHS